MIINPETGRPYRKDYFKDYARGKPCLLRIASSCGFQGCADFDTTVLCHLRLGGLSGVALKANDLLGAWGCHMCHSIIDGAAKVPLALGIDRDTLQLWHHHGVDRTLDQLVKDGVLAYEL